MAHEPQPRAHRIDTEKSGEGYLKRTLSLRLLFSEASLVP
jgi:hypothetical protein